jgi:hypothetical protein
MRVVGHWPAAIAAGAFLALTAATPVAPASSAAESPAPACCFKNPRVTGTCEVRPAEGETCASILAYLNQAQSVGKSYCGNTEIRGGWEQVSCASPAPSPAAGGTPRR